MNSHRTDEFITQFRALPIRVQNQARRAYRLWQANPYHPSLDFKLVGRRTPSYSVRVGIGWRALGYRQGELMVWFWIGWHAKYDQLLKGL